jgi:hypothetical protein
LRAAASRAPAALPGRSGQADGQAKHPAPRPPGRTGRSHGNQDGDLQQRDGGDSAAIRWLFLPSAQHPAAAVPGRRRGTARTATDEAGTALATSGPWALQKQAFGSGPCPAPAPKVVIGGPSGSLLTQDVEVQAAARRDRVDQGLQLPRRGRLGPCRPPAPQRDPGGKPGAYRAQRLRPGRCRRRDGGVRPPSLRGGVRAAVPQSGAMRGRRGTRRASRSRRRS